MRDDDDNVDLVLYQTAGTHHREDSQDGEGHQGALVITPGTAPSSSSCLAPWDGTGT